MELLYEVQDDIKSERCFDDSMSKYMIEFD